jgi:hypothetical protein
MIARIRSGTMELMEKLQRTARAAAYPTISTHDIAQSLSLVRTRE